MPSCTPPAALPRGLRPSDPAVGIATPRLARRSRSQSARPLSARLAGCLLALATACDGSIASDDAGSSARAVARFELPEDGPLDFASVPFPSDLYLDEGGHPRIGALPLREDARLVATRELLALRRGFCATCNAYFAIDGPLDTSSLPESATHRTVPTALDPIVMADVDPSSPERGRLLPLRVEHDARRGVIAVRPVRGIVLRRGRRYAVALTAALRGERGPLEPSSTFVEVRDGDGGGASVQRARAILGPALDELASIGLPRERVVALASFTVGDPSVDLRDARAAVHAASTPIASVDRVWSTPEELDALLGVPGEDRPGIDVPPAAGTEGTRAIRHASVALVVGGRFGAPRLVTGSGTAIGAPRRDAEGRLIGGPLEDVPFVLTVPAGAAMPLPVLVHHHGFNASRVTGFALAETAARAGVAVLSIDGFQHGERAHQRRDELHQMRGVVGADGFSETDMLAVSSRVFGIEGAEEDMRLFAGYPLGAFLQLAADVMAAVRFVREGDPSALRASAPALADLSFGRVLYAGNSMGAVIGTLVLAVERDVDAFVLNVLPGSIVDSLADGAEFRPLAEAVFLPVLGVRPGFDEVTRSVTFDLLVDLLRWAIEPIDPHALAPYLFFDPAADGRPDVLVQLASLDQLAAPTGAQAMLAAAGIPGVGEYDIADVRVTDAPVSANLETTGGARTVAAVRFHPAGHGMLEIASQLSTHELPLVPPLVPRPSPITIENPIIAVHDQIEHFLRTAQRGRAEIIAP